VLIESSTGSEWIARVLEGLGHEVIVADPNYAPMYSHRTRRIKTDRRDARALAEACRVGAYQPAHRTTDPRRHIRAVSAVRENLVRTRTRWILLVRALLRREGLSTRTGHAESFVERVLELELSPALHEEIEPLLDLLGPVNDQLDAVDGRLAHLAREDDAARRLMTMPGVGPVVALAFVATVDRIDRFRSAHQLESYLASCLENGAPARFNEGARSRKWETSACDGCWFKLHARSCEHPIGERLGRSGSGPTVSGHVVAVASRLSHWPGALPAFSMRCGGTEPSFKSCN
jgi:transposase